MLLGLILKEYDNMEEALSASQKSIDLSPNDEVAINCYGIVLKHFGKFNEAEKIFNEAIILKPEFAEPYNNLGIILKILGRNEEAKENYLKAINLKSNFTEAYNNLGVLLKSLGNYKEAFECYKKVISITPNNDKAYYFMGIILYELDRLQEAQACFEKSVSFNPENTESKHLLSALMGEKTNSAPKEYVEKLFDDFASTFDDHLVKNLEYKTPKIISNDELADLTKTINRLIKDIKHLLSQKDQLLLDASHELRSPLARMKFLLAMMPEHKNMVKLNKEIDSFEEFTAAPSLD